jgi:hypothetical protein
MTEVRTRVLLSVVLAGFMGFIIGGLIATAQTETLTTDHSSSVTTWSSTYSPVLKGFTFEDGVIEVTWVQAPSTWISGGNYDSIPYRAWKDVYSVVDCELVKGERITGRYVEEKTIPSHIVFDE